MWELRKARTPTTPAVVYTEASYAGGLYSFRRYVQVEPMDTEYVKEFEKALGKWDDHRFVSAEDIRTLAMFSLYLVNLADAAGWTYKGHSWKESEYLGCLVVKGIVDSVPSVVFTSGSTYTASVRIFLRKLEEDFLEWVPDKYAR